MKDTLIKIQELFDLMTKEQKELELELQRTNLLTDQLKVAQTELDAKTVEISEREAVVSKIENVAQLSAETKKLQNQVSVDRLQLSKEKEAFDKFRIEESDKLQEQKLANEKESARLVEKEKAMEGDVKKRVTDILKNAKVNIVTG